MITYKKATLDEKEITDLIKLSKMWEEEDCTFGLIGNTKDDIHEPLYVAYDDDKLIGYIMGKYFIEDEKRSYVEIGDKCFEVEELYVIPNYRSRGIGRNLFSLIEKEVKENVKYIVLATSTKDYKKTLKFYVDDNDMVYHSAFLIKKTK